MEEAGRKLKQIRERLNLRYRDITEASDRIAEQYDNSEFRIVQSRLSDIEKGVVPSLYRLYSLCVIYRIDYAEALEWYGVKLHNIPADAAKVRHPYTHMSALGTEPDGEAVVPLSLNPGVDLKRT